MRGSLKVLAAALILWSQVSACDEDGPSGPRRPGGPVITSVSPSEAVPGQSVTINGSNFGSDASLVTVTFDALLAPITSVSPTAIVAVVPAALTPGTTTLRVFVSGISVPATATITIVEPPQPVITGFDPDPALAGEPLTILGRDFGENVGEATVTLDALPVQIVSVTDDELVVDVPNTVAGIVPVVVTVRGRASEPRTLTVIASGPSPAGAIVGRVTSTATGQPIGGAAVTTSPATASVLTDAQGNYRIEDVPPGGYRVTATREGFDSASADVLVAAGQATAADLALRPLGESTIFGRVTNAATGAGIQDAEVTLSVIADTVPVVGDTIPIASDATDALGNYRIDDVAPGRYVLTARADGFAPLSVEVTAVAGQLVFVNFPLTPGAAAVTSRDGLLATRSTFPSERGRRRRRGRSTAFHP